MRIEIAKRVVAHYQKFPLSFPKSKQGDEWKLLDMPWPMTDEEGEVLSQLMPYAEHIDDVAKRLGRNKNGLIPLLDGLLHKGWLVRDGTKEGGFYWVNVYHPGVGDMQFHSYAPEHLQYMATEMDAFESTFGATPDILPWFRVVPREKAIPYDVEVLPSELLSHIIETVDEGELAGHDCVCRVGARHRGEGCDSPSEDTCIFFGPFAKTSIETGMARALTKAEVWKILKRTRDAGLIHQACTSEHQMVICSCCPCCCAPLRLMIAGVPQANLHSNFYSEVNFGLCKGTCPECIKVCPVKAITLDKKNMRPTINLEKCIGCGICVEACPENALTLKRRKDVVIYPRTWADMLRVRAQQTGRTEFYPELSPSK